MKKHITDAELMAPLLKKPRGKQLTKKQKDFAKAVANGVSGVAAYRKAYDIERPADHHRNDAYKLKQNPHVAATIETLQKAKELTESLSAAGLRAFITSELLAHAQNDELKASDRLNALKLLGTLSDVSAYTHRTESVQIKASVDIKEQLMEKLKLIGHSSTPEASSNKPSASSAAESDADSLLDELRNDPAVIDGELIERGTDFEQQADSVEADSQIDDSEQGASNA